MKIIEQCYEILECSVCALETIELAGRTCYKSEDKIGCTIPQDEQGPENCPDVLLALAEENMGSVYCTSECQHHSSRKFVKMLQSRGHHAMIEFGDIIVKFITNRGVTHEIVRHRMCSFAQESTRYVRYDGQMEFIRPVWCSDAILGLFNESYDFDSVENHAENSFLSSLFLAEDHYKDLLSNGWRPEQAREVLPNSLKTEIVVKANIREWHHILTLRTAKAAHPQMRALMLPLLEELKTKIPVIFSNINVKGE